MKTMAMLIFIGVVTAALIVDVVPSVAAENGVHDVTQGVQVGHLNGRPAAPQLLSVDIIPDAPPNGAGLRMEKGVAPPIAVPVKEPMRGNSGAGR